MLVADIIVRFFRVFNILIESGFLAKKQVADLPGSLQEFTMFMPVS